MEDYQMLVGGSWRGANETGVALNPALGTPMANIPQANTDDVELAVETSRAALENPEWRNMDPAQRGRILQAMAQKTYAHAKELAALESQNNGKTFREALGDVRFAAWTLEYYGGWADKIEGTTIPVPGDRLNYTLRQPVGVTAHIVPWNFPLQLAVRSIAPALATGCTVIAKPASLTPVSLLAWAKLMDECGLPSGVLQIITGPGGAVGGALSKHKGVDSVTLTGSVETGKQVMASAAENLNPVTLELGGKGAHIVMPDANLKLAAKGVCFGIFMNAGQMCWAGSRLIAHESIHDELVEAIKTEAAKWKVGPGMEEGVRIGSMVSKDQQQSVLDYVEKGLGSGAELIMGGQAPVGDGLDQGAFVHPTILAHAEKGNPCWDEEIFGPVLATQSFTDQADALAKANDCDFGLLNGIWTQQLGTAHQLARDLECGMVSVNEFPITFPQTPFTGWKASGIGAEQGKVALDFYTRVKNVNVRL